MAIFSSRVRSETRFSTRFSSGSVGSWNGSAARTARVAQAARRRARHRLAGLLIGGSELSILYPVIRKRISAAILSRAAGSRLVVPLPAIGRINEGVGGIVVGDPHGFRIPRQDSSLPVRAPAAGGRRYGQRAAAQGQRSKQGELRESACELDRRDRLLAGLAHAHPLGVVIRLFAARQRRRRLLKILELSLRQEPAAGQAAHLLSRPGLRAEGQPGVAAIKGRNLHASFAYE